MKGAWRRRDVIINIGEDASTPQPNVGKNYMKVRAAASTPTTSFLCST